LFTIDSFLLAREGTTGYFIFPKTTVICFLS